MAKVTVLTVVPTRLVADLESKKRVKDYNTLPQLNADVLETIRAFVSDRIGYGDLPMACLGQPKGTNGKITTNFMEYIPANSKDSVLFVLEMPDDMIVSVDYKVLLDTSAMFNQADREEIPILKEDFTEHLILGMDDGNDNSISFIPFLDYSRCKFYATMDPTFSVNSTFSIPGLEQINMRELTSFVN